MTPLLGDCEREWRRCCLPGGVLERERVAERDLDLPLEGLGDLEWFSALGVGDLVKERPRDRDRGWGLAERDREREREWAPSGERDRDGWREGERERERDRERDPVLSIGISASPPSLALVLGSASTSMLGRASCAGLELREAMS